jgi:predicted DNA-binding mobile mystery protein A
MDLMRKQLDKQLNKIRGLEQVAPPAMGWVKAIRKSLGMTRAQLAVKMGISSQAIQKLEESEAQRTISLKSLEKISHSLNCKLLYVLIPEEPLQDLVETQIKRKAQETLAKIHHSMLLEEQGTSHEMLEDQLVEIGNEIKRKKNISMIWDL